VPPIRIFASNFVAHHPLQPKRGKTSMDEEGDSRRRRESFPTPLIASKSLSQAPKVFLFVKNEESSNTLVETWLNNHIRVLGSIILPNGFILAQRGLKSTFPDMCLAGRATFSPSDSNTAFLVCHFRPASYQLAQRVTLAPNGHFLAFQGWSKAVYTYRWVLSRCL